MVKREIWDWPPMARLRTAVRESGLFSPGTVVVGRAPGRLDVMGGIADYSGSLVCEMPLAVAGAAAAQARADERVVCRSVQVGRSVTIPAGALAGADPATVRALLDGDDAWARYALGCGWWLVNRGGQAASPWAADRGVTVLVDSDVPLGAGVSSSAAVEVACMAALARLAGIEMDGMTLAAACQQVENLIAGAPCGVMDQVTASLGRPGAMLEILCQPGADRQPAQVLGAVPVPAGYTLVGVHSGVCHEVSGDPYTQSRVAAFMGQKILAGLPEGDVTDGWLANVDAAAYEQRWRARLPERMRGEEFLSRHGQTNDPVTRVQPQGEYHVRAATDHHVLEMARVRRFVALVKATGAAASPVDAQAGIEQAGRLMYESHASYSRCANLGHPLTDRLVNMVQAQGWQRGFFGARITGGGSGGTVAVLMRDSDDCRAAVHELRRRYQRESGRKTTYFEDTSPGAAVLGTTEVEV